MKNITVIIDGIDFSGYVQQTEDITEQLRKIYGEAQDQALDGTTIPNLVAVKWDPSFKLKPLPQSKMNALIALMEKETVSLAYTSFKTPGSGTRAITALPLSCSVSYATNSYSGERVYEPTIISFQEQ